MSNFLKLRPVEAELLHVDRRTDGRTEMTKLTVAFRNFTNASKNVVTYTRSSKLFFSSQTGLFPTTAQNYMFRLRIADIFKEPYYYIDTSSISFNMSVIGKLCIH